MAAGDADMDDLVASFSISSDPLSTDAPHPRFSQYKSKTYAEKSQSKRRNEFLETQKGKRQDQFMIARAIALEKSDFESGTPERRARAYKDQLMLSEWMVEKPEDFDENWIMVPSPEGRRSLVVASRGVTTAYSKSGWMMKQFSSWLPGGHTGNKGGYSLLDCIFSEANGTFYVLDIMCWKQQPVYDSEYRFEALPSYSCDPKSLHSAMEQNFSYKVDGLLFYHREALYFRGERTPLVEWLKPFMLPEILGISVPDSFLQGHQHETAAEFVENFNKEIEDKNQNREKAKADKQSKKNDNMDCAVSSENTGEEKKETEKKIDP